MSTTPLRTAEKDVNYLSLNRNTVVLWAGTTDETQIPETDSIPLFLVPVVPKNWDSVLKCSDRHSTQLFGLQVAQGKENALDINNRSSVLRFSGDWGTVGDEGEQVITVKGGSRDILVKGVVHSRGRRADIAIGLYSDQSDEPTSRIDLSGLRHATGRPLTVILCRVNSPIMAAFGKPRDISLPPGAKVLLFQSLGAQVLYWAKWTGVKLGVVK